MGIIMSVRVVLNLFGQVMMLCLRESVFRGRRVGIIESVPFLEQWYVRKK